MDKRIVKTRKAVFKAAFDLVMEKEPEKITVLELCKRAGINKSTFYLHYGGIEDCLEKCFDFVMDSLIQFCKTIKYDDIKANAEKNVDIILDEVEKNMDYLIKAKYSRIGALSIRAIKDNIVQAIADANKISPQDDYDKYINIAYLVGGMYDAIFTPLPTYNREVLERRLVDSIRKSDF